MSYTVKSFKELFTHECTVLIIIMMVPIPPKGQDLFLIDCTVKEFQKRFCFCLPPHTGKYSLYNSVNPS